MSNNWLLAWKEDGDDIPCPACNCNSISTQDGLTSCGACGWVEDNPLDGGSLNTWAEKRQDEVDEAILGLVGQLAGLEHFIDFDGFRLQKIRKAIWKYIHAQCPRMDEFEFYPWVEDSQVTK